MRTRINLHWQKLRGRFNHDWLKNQYMPALAKYLNILDDRVEDEEFERSFVSEILPEWEHHRAEALMLARDFEGALSPRCLFEMPPLSRCDETTRQWLGDLAHALWLRRYPVEQWVSAAIAAIESADHAYRRLRELLQESQEDDDAAQATRAHHEQFVEFRALCQNLANAVSRFPSEIKVA